MDTDSSVSDPWYGGERGERKEEEIKRYRFCKRKSAVESSQPQFLEKPVLELWRPRLPPTKACL